MKSLMIAATGALVAGAAALTPVPAAAQTSFSFGVYSGGGYYGGPHGYYDRGYYGGPRGYWRGDRRWRDDRRWRGNGRWNRAGYWGPPSRVVCRYNRWGEPRNCRRVRW